MKKVTLLMLSFLFLNTSFAQMDTVTVKKVAQLEVIVNGLKQSIESINTKLSILPSTPPQTPQVAKEVLKPLALSNSQKVLTLLPVILFLIVFFTIIIWLQRNNFKISDALSGDRPIEVTIPNPITPAAVLPNNAGVPAAAASPNPATINITKIDSESGQPEMPKSSSRLIALFSGFTAIIIAVCLVSYYVYFGIRGTPAPDFNNLFEAILGIGIGVVPYAVNKLTQNNK